MVRLRIRPALYSISLFTALVLQLPLWLFAHRGEAYIDQSSQCPVTNTYTRFTLITGILIAVTSLLALISAIKEKQASKIILATVLLLVLDGLAYWALFESSLCLT